MTPKPLLAFSRRSFLKASSLALAGLLVMATGWPREWPAGRAVGADAALVLWLARGWCKQKFRRKPVLPV